MGEKLDAYVTVHRHHVGTTEQRRDAASVFKMFTGRENWDAADAIVGAWLHAAPATSRQALEASDDR